jgi:outer membrane lipoprotein-sorting protein
MKAKVFFALLPLAFGAAVHAQTPDADTIIQRARNRSSAATTLTRMRMVVTDKKGSSTELALVQAEKKDAAGNNQTVIEFEKPATFAGARFLSVENKGRENEQRIKLKGQSSSRRIQGAEGSKSFMGTDLSNDDIASTRRAQSLDTHKAAGSETLNGRPCWIIESRPKDPKYQYSLMKQWIDQETYLTWKVEMYNAKGKHIKTLEVLKTAMQGDVLTIMQYRMTTLAENTSTTMHIDKIVYNAPIDDAVFTESFLRSGRPELRLK